MHYPQSFAQEDLTQIKQKKNYNLVSDLHLTGSLLAGEIATKSGASFCMEHDPDSPVYIR